MKKFRILFFAIFLCAFALPALAQDKVDIFGYYSIVKPTKDFADISEIHLGGDYGEQQNPKFYGLIRMKSKRAIDYKLMKPSLSGKNLTFSTKSVGNISYKFVGAFTKLGDFPELQPNGEVLLKGTLTKYRGKKKIASANVKFSYEAGD
ncbi:MAG TPA: hypothetical protein VGC76_11065 [Pyrinomonadaceae bacterium]|jgi:hypothetical protein